MAKRVLLTGAGGFLGAQFLSHAIEMTDWEFVCPVSFKHRGVPQRIVEVAQGSWSRVDVIYCDLAAPIADTTDYQFGSIDMVVNFASESHIPRSISDPVPFVQNNVNLMLHLLDWAKRRTLDAFVQISTDEVYGPVLDTGYGHHEWSPTVPSTPYSASKAAQEALAISWWRTYNLPLILVNTMNPLGFMQDSEKFLPLVLRRVKRGEKVQIHASADGEIGSRVYINALDLADAVVFLLERERVTRYQEGFQSHPDRWNVTGERSVDNLELAQLIAAAAGRDLSYETLPSDRPGHGLRYALDGGKLQLHGWHPSYTIEETVQQVVAWTLRNPLWRDRIPGQ